MGKGEEEHTSSESVIVAAQNNENAEIDCSRRCCFWKNFLSLRCVIVLIVTVGVFLSALFCLPFFHFRDQSGPDLDSEFGGHSVVASFTVNKSRKLLQDNILRLQDDIFSIISFPSTEMNILLLDSSDGSNTTQVVFAVDSDETSRSLVRDAFVSLIINQSSLGLTESLFGDPFNFEVLKFVGGITVSPQQSAFLMQKVQILFNFTLNFSIHQLIYNFGQLQKELKSGLHLSLYENLYISLINGKGSTVASPAIVKCRVLMAVGINPSMSMSRIKQLAQTISGSQKNLGLNNTVFGRVKQVRLSILEHSLGSPSPSPSPSPSSSSTPRFHGQNHHRHHHTDSNFAPITPPSSRNGNKGTGSSPTPAPAPRNRDKSSGCHFGYKNRYHHSHLSPISPPVLAPKIVAPSPNRINDPHTHVAHSVPASSPLPNVILAHHRPPSEKEFNAIRPDLAPPAVSPSISSSSSGESFLNLWALMWFLFIVLQL